MLRVVLLVLLVLIALALCTRTENSGETANRNSAEGAGWASRFRSSGSLMVQPGPKYPPTRGAVWPRPQHEARTTTYYTFDPRHFTVQLTGHNCSLLRSAVDRALHHLGRAGERALRARRARSRPTLRRLAVHLSAPCEDYPHFRMDEGYNLTVASMATLRSYSIWGVMRGLETFSQLIYLSDDYNDLLINRTDIVDYPRYSHRGLLIDTSRHFITMRNILLTLDAMAMNKMNVLHWHIVDDQSFPYQSEKFPELSERGAYHPTMVYTKADIRLVVRYARERGIRVLPEIDVPGHTRSWGVAYPNILTECYKDNKVVGLGPMNPINNSTYKLLKDLIQEVQEWFPDKYYHIGGDEVDLDCWSSNPELLDYMSHQNLSSVKQLHALFMNRVIPLLGDRSQPIVWQEVFDEKVPLSKDTLVQVWRNGWTKEINNILEAGHKVLFSAAWYLDHLSTGGDWEPFYTADPEHMVANASLARNVVGGEACMWGETVDDRNIISRVWPRASAVAEVLWSSSRDPGRPQASLDLARRRLEEHTCRMIRHDIAAQPPNGPGFCVV